MRARFQTRARGKLAMAATLINNTRVVSVTLSAATAGEGRASLLQKPIYKGIELLAGTPREILV